MLLGMRFHLQIAFLSWGAARRLLALAIPFIACATLSFAERASSSEQPVDASAQGTSASQAAISLPSGQAGMLNVVVLDPAHGGVDYGARGTEGVRESEVVMEFAVQVRRALESQGFQVVQTRLAMKTQLSMSGRR